MCAGEGVANFTELKFLAEFLQAKKIGREYKLEFCVSEAKRRT